MKLLSGYLSSRVDILRYAREYMYMYMQRQLISFRKIDCLGSAVLLCLVVCLTLLASFFLPSHLSLKHVHASVAQLVERSV